MDWTFEDPPPPPTQAPPRKMTPAEQQRAIEMGDLERLLETSLDFACFAQQHAACKCEDDILHVEGKVLVSRLGKDALGVF